MLDLREVFSVTDFLRNHREHIARLQESGKRVVLTVNGKPAVVMQDAAGCQSLLDELTTLKSILKDSPDSHA